MTTKLTLLFAVGIVSGCASGPHAGVSSSDAATTTFLLQAGSSNELEVQSAQIALQTINPSVRSFAQMLIADHKQLDDELAVAAPPGLVPPPALLPLPQDKLVLDELRDAPPGAFDDPRYFAGVQIKAHEQTIGLFMRYANAGGDRRLRAFARHALPLLKKHLAAARALMLAPWPSM
jgi:putative membrane protein